MTRILPAAIDWAAKHFGGLHLGDARLTREP